MHCTVPPVRPQDIVGELSHFDAAGIDRPFMSAAEYLMYYEPNIYGLMLDPDKEDYQEDYKRAHAVAVKMKEPGLTFPGQSLTLYRSCVWALVYSSQN